MLQKSNHWDFQMSRTVSFIWVKARSEISNLTTRKSIYKAQQNKHRISKDPQSNFIDGPRMISYDDISSKYEKQSRNCSLSSDTIVYLFLHLLHLSQLNFRALYPLPELSFSDHLSSPSTHRGWLEGIQKEDGWVGNKWRERDGGDCQIPFPFHSSPLHQALSLCSRPLPTL